MRSDRFRTRAEARTGVPLHKKVKKFADGTWGPGFNKQKNGKAVTRLDYNTTRLHKPKSKSIYSFHHGKKSCGSHGRKNPITGWCRGQMILKGRRKLGSYYLRQSKTPYKRRKRNKRRIKI